MKLLPDIENYTLVDWIGWFTIVIAIGALGFGLMAYFGV